MVLDASDVAGAFQRVDVNESNVSEFASDVPADIHGEPVLPEVDDMVTPPASAETRTVLTAARVAAAKLAKSVARDKYKAAATAAVASSTTLLTILYLTGTFGSVLLPPQYGMCAMKPISDYHNSFVCACPAWHGYEEFSSWTYVDDTVDVEADWGLQRWASRHTLMEGFFAFLGVHSFNVSKASAGYATEVVA